MLNGKCGSPVVKKRKTKESTGQLLNGIGKLIINKAEKADMFNVFPPSDYTKPFICQISTVSSKGRGKIIRLE